MATLADVRDTIVATEIIERADFSESGLLTPDERRAVADLDRIIVANCGVGLSPQFGVLGPHVGRFDVTDPDAQPGGATTTTVAVAVVDTSTTSTSLPTRLPNAPSRWSATRLTLRRPAGDHGHAQRARARRRRRRRSGEPAHDQLDRHHPLRARRRAGDRGGVVAEDLGHRARHERRRVRVVGPARSASSVERVLAAIPPDALVVWVDTWIRDERDAVVAGNLIIRDVVAQRAGAVVADFFSYGDDPGIVGGDGVHLTAAGRTLFANVMANGIADVLGRNPLFDLGSPPRADHDGPRRRPGDRPGSATAGRRPRRHDHDDTTSRPRPPPAPRRRVRPEHDGRVDGAGTARRRRRAGLTPIASTVQLPQRDWPKR